MGIRGDHFRRIPQKGKQKTETHKNPKKETEEKQKIEKLGDHLKTST